jgi:hypothetical protein
MLLVKHDTPSAHRAPWDILQQIKPLQSASFAQQAKFLVIKGHWNVIIASKASMLKMQVRAFALNVHPDTMQANQAQQAALAAIWASMLVYQVLLTVLIAMKELLLQHVLLLYVQFVSQVRQLLKNRVCVRFVRKVHGRINQCKAPV